MQKPYMMIIAITASRQLTVKWLFVLAFTTWLANPALAADTYINGTVTDITSLSSGLLIRVNGSEKPSQCTQTSAWMLVPEENATMVSVVLAAYFSGKRDAVVYVDIASTGKYCKVIQYDPQNQ